MGCLLYVVLYVGIIFMMAGFALTAAVPAKDKENHKYGNIFYLVGLMLTLPFWYTKSIWMTLAFGVFSTLLLTYLLWQRRKK